MFPGYPSPVSPCAQAYRQNVLRYTKDDSTTDGYSRASQNVRLLRKMYFDGLRYDSIVGGWVSCEGGFVVAAYEMKHNQLFLHFL